MTTSVGVLCAVGAALCYGIGSVLQALGAARAQPAVGLDPTLLVRLGRQLPYVLGLAVDGLGFVVNVLALQVLPLFLVQSVVAGSVAVTAVTAAVVLRTALTRTEVGALAVLVSGLGLLAYAAQPGAARPLSDAAGWGLLAGVGALTALAALLARRTGGAVLLASLAGGAFAGVGITARGIPLIPPLWRVVGHPATWALVGFGLLATLLFATALQRGTVTAVSAATLVVETVVPAAVGLLVLGDRTRPGSGVLAAVLGFALALAGALALAPHAKPRGAG